MTAPPTSTRSSSGPRASGCGTRSTDPEFTTQYFHGTASSRRSSPERAFVNRIVDAGSPAADGTIEVFDPPRRLVIHVARPLRRGDGGGAAEPSRMALTPATTTAR